MSNEPSSKRLLADLLPDPADAGAEAIGPDTVARLRADLGEMTELIAQVGAVYEAAGSTDEGVAALLHELDVRVRRMRAIVDPAARAVDEPQERTPEEQAFLEAMEPNGDVGLETPQPEPDRVPTVSDVVWQLGLDAGTPDAPGADQPDDGKMSAVAMLEARVKALAEAMPQAPPAGTPSAAPEPAASEDAAPWPEPAAPPPHSPAMPELMWNFQRMESEPYFPPEVGEAVIFGAKERVEADVSTEPAPLPPEPVETERADVDLDALLFEPPEPEADPAAFLLEQEPAPEPEQPPAESAAPATEAPSAPEPVSETPDAATWDVEPAVPAGAPPPGTQPDGPQDPLAPLMAMSDEEKIALFE